MAATFRMFGIPVQIDPWFLLGLLFVYQFSGGERVGMIAAIAIGVLTLIHELGHALAARHYGCTVSIRLNLFVGWASYQSPQPLRRGQQIVISLLGPFSQIGTAFVAMALVHRLFLSDAADRLLLFDLWQGLGWAGVVIALLNLLPLWPLDGGHVVHHVLGRFLDERRALATMLAITAAGLVSIVLLGVVSSNGDGFLARERFEGPFRAASAIQYESTIAALAAQIRWFPTYVLRMPWFLLLFSGLATVQAYQSLRPRPEPVTAPGDPSFVEASVITAETRGWDETRLPDLPAGWTSSPWLRAHIASSRGDEAGVRAAFAQLTSAGRRWVLPDPARPELGPLVDRLAEPLPIGELGPSLVVLRVLAHHGPADRFLRYATALYERTRAVEALLMAAAGLVRRSHHDDAMRWLERAMREAPDPARLTTDPAYLPLHGRPDFQQLVTEVSTPR